MVRFENGTPTAVWYSQHNNGEAFKYPILEKNGLRVSLHMGHVNSTNN